MRRVSGWIGLVALASCGSNHSTPSIPHDPMAPRPPRAATPPPPTDEAGFRRLLSGEVVNGGLWFTDPVCRDQFAKPGPIPATSFEAFARCVAGLQLRGSGRVDALANTSVLTDRAGFEIEAHVVGGRLDFIGFSGRAPGAPDLPTITPKTLESLRVGGDPNATITDEQAKAVVIRGVRSQTEHLRLCLSEAGEIATILPAAPMTSVESLTAYTAIARSWKFKPFVVDGAPIAACAIVGFQYPAVPPDPDRDYLPRPPMRSKAGNIIYKVSPREIEPLRLTGTKTVIPDDEDRLHLSRRLVGTFKVCLDETGHYESGTLLVSTGLSRYDARIARALMSWSYRPFVVDGVAIPVCFAITFVYAQE